MSVILKSLEEQLLARAADYDRHAKNTPNRGKMNHYIERSRLFKELATVVSLAEESV